jgi:hypothetical protein
VLSSAADTEGSGRPLLTTAGPVYGVLAHIVGRECPDDSRVTIGRLILHLGSPSPVVVLGPHAELALAPRAIDEDFDIGAVAGLRHVELGHGRTGTVAADGGREALDEALAKRSLECLGAYGRDATRRCFQVLEPDSEVAGTKSVGRQASIAHAPSDRLHQLVRDPGRLLQTDVGR